MVRKHQTDRIARAAALIADARLAGRRLDLLPDGVRPHDEAEAYAVQAALHARLEEAGRGPVSGHKIGCTTEVMQRYLEIDNPCAGGIFAPTVHDGMAELDSRRFGRIGVECEIAVRLVRDLEPHGGGHNRRSVADAVGALMPAIEVVEDRYQDFRAFDTPTLIADDFFNAGCVLGPPLEAWRDLDLERLEGWMLVNGSEVGRGRGGDILGHPFEALAWLASSLNARDDLLRAESFVLLGSVVQTVWLEAGDRAEIEIASLGSARLSLV